jgi:hypothetical protein
MKNNGHIRGYISAKETIEAARNHGLTICDYLEMIWHQQGDTQRIIDNIKAFGIIDSKPDVICEIGAGSGRYTEKVLQLHRPQIYEVYEPDQTWSSWLKQCYGVNCCHSLLSKIN